MKERKATAKAIGSLITQFSNEELLALTDRRNMGAVREFLRGLIIRSAESMFVEFFDDNEAIKRFPQFVEHIPKYRRLAAELAYTGPMVWLVKKAFTLKKHAAKAGPCRKNFEYLQDWDFEDKPTQDSLVFWVPRLLPESTNKTVNKQLALLAKTCQRFELPDHHLSSFGGAALNAALILAEFARSGDRVPLNKFWARTDTCGAGGSRLHLGGFDEGGLRCARWFWDGNPSGYLGCFVLGVENLGD